MEMFELFHAVSPGNGVLAHRLRLIRCLLTQDIVWAAAALELAWAREGAYTGAWRKLTLRSAVATEVSAGQRVIGCVSVLGLHACALILPFRKSYGRGGSCGLRVQYC